MPIRVEETAQGIAIRGLEERIANPEVFLRQVGLIGVGISQRAFKDQEFNGVKWEARYPNQNGAKLNVAGALADAAAGRPAPLARRFNDRPAGLDTGTLKNSISYAVEGDYVVVGTTNAHAEIMQQGGVTTQPITPGMRTVIAGWLKKTRREAKRAKKKLGEIDITKKEVGGAFKKLDKNEALSRLVFVFFKRGGSYLVPEKKTTHVARPFIGLTDEWRKKIVAWGRRWFSTGKGA